ncbi:uncharacterized protein, partial [Euwallacea similis]|uniref:uncharacterized protein n=1 Tax=Euwallacea similis TaxID=1736056 RepID=UPI0034503553
MLNYTNQEMANMVFVYGLADGKCLAARRIYMERFPNHQAPNHQTFKNLFQRLCDTGSLLKTPGGGKPITRRTPEVEEEILRRIEENPGTSTRKIVAVLNISHKVVWTVLKEQQLYPYHIQRVQALLPQDYPPRIQFSQLILQKVALDPQFLSRVLFTDEATFSRSAIINFHNNHIWADENPHSIVDERFQHQFSLNVWAGIVGDYLIGPYFLPHHLNGETYLYFLQNTLSVLLEEVPIAQ